MEERLSLEMMKLIEELSWERPGQKAALPKETHTERAVAVEKRPGVPQETNSCMESPRNPYTYTQEHSENAKAAEHHPTRCGERQGCIVHSRCKT